jgi:alginate O-acetyltransferase complex protein AlgI
MLFNSLQFLVFFLVITLSYYQLKNLRARSLLLLIASCYFYMSFVPKYILILGATIVIDYFAGIQIARSHGRSRKIWLILSIISNVGILVYFKYFNFLLDNLASVIHVFDPGRSLPFLEILLPIGLSFHTFQAMSYTIEVYRGKYPAERDFVTYSLYVMFYPQLVAGPIERPQNVLPQLHQFHAYDWNNVKDGLARMAWGMFKKVVIADRLAMAVDYSYDHIHSQSAPYLMLGAIFYSFQIYCDFSGYSDIGIGAAKVMGIRLMENFNEPYRAHSIASFWSRWHISLSTWFKDYVYFPLGGNRLGERRRKINAMIIFLLSGIWHGANWTFVIWGGLHGALTALFPGRKKSYEGSRLRKLIFILINFLLVTIFWIFFRASSVREATAYIVAIFTFQEGTVATGLNNVEIILAFLLIGFMLYREAVVKSFYIKDDKRFYGFMVLAVITCYFLGVFNENQFIYFQF